jgi:hypothetical protein
MKDKKEKSPSSLKGSDSTKHLGKDENKKGIAPVDTGRATDKVNHKSGRGLANEGTNVSYEEET